MTPACTWASILVGNSGRHMEYTPQSDHSQGAGLYTPKRRCCSGGSMASLPGLPRSLGNFLISAPKILWAGKPLRPNLDGGSHYLDDINPPAPDLSHTGRSRLQGTGPNAGSLEIPSAKMVRLKGMRWGHQSRFRGEKSEGQR